MGSWSKVWKFQVGIALASSHTKDALLEIFATLSSRSVQLDTWSDIIDVLLDMSWDVVPCFTSVQTTNNSALKHSYQFPPF